tara:strand:+ start:153 stop:908 length:756 start_codon:yes stop_codon:yes gene_type:complete
MLGLLRNIKDSFYFELGSVIIILLAAIIYGVDTFSLSDSISETIAILDYTISIIFITEIFIRMVAERKLLNFFKDPWNSFDFIIVSVSLIPVDAFANILVARIIRVFRILRLITHVQKFKALINAFFNSLPRVFYVMALMFVFFYIYAILGTTFFGDIDPERWGNLFLSLWTLFQIATFENWPDIMQVQFAINQNSWLFFFTFIIVIAFILMNMIVGIIVDTISQENEEETRMEEEILAKLAEIENKINKL